MKRLLKPVTASSEVSTYDIPVKWEMRVVLQIQAYNLKDAIQRANKKEFSLTEGEYVDDSYEIDFDRMENCV